MKTDTPQTVYLKDYKPYPFEVESLDLNFDIHDGYTIVTAKSTWKRLNEKAQEVFLNGEHLELMSVKVNGADIDDYKHDEKALRVPCPQGPAGDAFELEITTRIQPEKNTSLQGLYKSGDTYCTQCEAEGFRHITYYPDRPDVMTTFTTRVEANKAQYPALLSNGNRLDHGDSGHGRHYAIWHDPFVKPCYLFALVAGDLSVVEDEFTTASGRKVELYIYVRPGDESQCGHAMESLKKSMRWDEEVYGLEYDLDLFNIVAVSDFNMGAMENKSLNIFNTALVLAQPETATDQDFIRVESVIAHEYFHNWSGNRVTCRDWFQLSLKEGLTVFRDQEFSSDLNSRAVQRIDDVAHLRRHQFPEDAGPIAHPIKPDNYIEINNFYTMTVYEKGAEVIRMLHTILGAENYRKGTDLYFERHDGQAVTCEDFVKALEDASGIDLTQFRRWYEQAGTPAVRFEGNYNENSKTYHVKLKQNIPDTPGQTDKKPATIPVILGLVGENGADIAEEMLMLIEAEQEFTLENISSAPIPSILRNFSAPVRLTHDLTDDDLAHLMVHDGDGFNRWEAGQTLMLRVLGGMIDGADVPASFIGRYGDLITRALDDGADKALMARALSIPDITRIEQEQDVIDPDAVFKAREGLLATLKRNHKPALEKLYKANAQGGDFSITPEAMGQRTLRNIALTLLTATHGTGCAKLAMSHYEAADNMTDRAAALSSLAVNKNPERAQAFDDFYARFKDYQLVIDKYFALQASAAHPEINNHLKILKQHTDFKIKNPNRVRSLYAAFGMMNPVKFHAADGSGYAFLRDGIMELNSINPQIAARLLTPFRTWKLYTPDRQELMKAALEEILTLKDIAPDVFEIASKSLK